MLIRTLNCQRCGGRTAIERGATEALCRHCGQPVRLSSAVLQEQSASAAHPPGSDLRLGMKGTYRAREWEIVGRQVFGMTDEDGFSSWDEWVLVNGDGELLYLEHDDGYWKLSRPFTPLTPPTVSFLSGLNSGDLLLLKPGIRSVVTDRGRAQLIHFEGEFPWLMERGKLVDYLDLRYLNQFYCVEWTADSLEFYEGEFLDERFVFNMFGMVQRVLELDRRATRQRDRAVFGAVACALGVISLVLGVFGMVGGAALPGGSADVDLSQVGPDGLRVGPIPLKSGGRVHRLDVDGTMSQSSVWVGAVLEDESESELVGADKDMWDESGYDPDGAWHESDLHASAHFLLKQPGPYFVRIYAERDPTGGVPAYARARVTVRQDTLDPKPVFLFGGGSIALGVVMLLLGAASKPSLQGAEGDE